MKIIRIDSCSECPNFFHCNLREEDEKKEIPKDCPLEDEPETLF